MSIGIGGALSESSDPFNHPTQQRLHEPQSNHDVDNENNSEEEMDEVGEDEDNMEAPSSTTKTWVSAQKLRHHSMFEALQAKVAKDVDEDEKPYKYDDEEFMSLKTIMAKQQSQRIIGSPRDYQMELFERAKVQNTIAVLDTGSGKTLIAVLLLRHVIDQELEDRDKGKRPRIAFFLTDKVALAVQQQAVLKVNLDQSVGLIYGNMRPETWTRENWAEHRKENMVTVCTPDVLIHSLLRSFLQIEDINLLIFDEAHHAKKEHPYAKIIKDAYMCEPNPAKRPRVFGMTASPVDGDSGDDLEREARELESLLHSTIATASDLKMFCREFAKRPDEQIARYPRLQPVVAVTDLYQQLYAEFGQSRTFHSLFTRAKELVPELGPWCSDHFWSFTFSDKATMKREAKLEHSRRARVMSHPDDVDAEIARLQQAHSMVQNFNLESREPRLASVDLSGKVMALFEQLHLEYERPTESKCLIFVERKDTARLLLALAQRLGGSNLKPGMLTGTSSEIVDAVKYSTREQAITMMKFRNQELNCLFATSVAEEGIDVPDCNLVIRFDPCKTTIQYIQSRGRARHYNSKFIHFMERDNLQHELMLKRAWAGEKSLQRLCLNLPEDRKVDVDGNLPLISDKGGASPRVYTVPSTGAKLTYDFSLVVLAHFASSIPHEENDDLSVNYVVTTSAGKFVCEVTLPVNSPISSAVGRLCSRKDTAKRSAAFEACILLKKGGYLDDYLLPIYAKKLPSMRNAQLALNAKSSNRYHMQSKPSCWAEGRGTFPTQLYLTAVSLQDQWDRPVRPLGLLTRSKLPILPDFPIFRISGQPCRVSVATAHEPIDVSAEKVKELTWFSLTIFKDLFNKTFENNPSNMSYWLTPLKMSVEIDSLEDKNPSRYLDWELVMKMHMQEPYRWSKDMQSEDLIGKFLIDPWDGGRRLFTKRVVPELMPTDPVPPDCVPGSRTNSIIDYSVRLFKNSRTKFVWDETQPVLEAEKTMHRLNVLADPNKSEQEALTKCFVCPEPLKISRLPSDIAAMCMLFPSIIHRIESYLIALEFADALRLQIRPDLALEAITKDADNSEDFQAEKINFQRGMGPNYERLEFIGDCFLKMATTISIFTYHAGHDEFAMHVDRMCLLCNKNLFGIAKENEWFKYIRSLSFSRRTWYPHGLQLLEGKGAKTQEQQAAVSQNLGDKTVADVCEAMIGASLISHYKSGYSDTSQFDAAVRAVTRFVGSNDHDMDKWKDYYQSYSLPQYQTEPSTASQRDMAQKLETEHPYRFKYPRLARCAFMHPSQPRMLEGLPSYQRLEFLGDALLDMTSIFHLIQNYPKADPQWYTEHKMAMVSNRFLSAVCVKLGFHRHLRHSHAGLENQIRHFIEDLEEAERQSNGAKDYWTSVKDPPKCLSDIVESYVGAIFVDSEYDYAVVQRFFDLHFKWFFEDMTIYDAFANDHPVTKLHSLLSETMGCSDYRVMVREMPWVDGQSSGVLAAVFVHETTVATYKGTSSRYAKVKAASNGLKALLGKAPYEFRREFNCTCKPLKES